MQKQTNDNLWKYIRFAGRPHLILLVENHFDENARLINKILNIQKKKNYEVEEKKRILDHWEFVSPGLEKK